MIDPEKEDSTKTIDLVNSKGSPFYKENSKGSPFYKEYERNEVKAYIVGWFFVFPIPAAILQVPGINGFSDIWESRLNSLVGEAPAVGVATCFMALIGAADPESP